MPTPLAAHNNESMPNDSPLARNARWLYRGGRPSSLARFLNRIWASVGSVGLTKNWLVTLEVTGRKSGKAVTFPLVIVRVAGVSYLVSMLGEKGQWVQNVRAAHGKAILHSGKHEDVTLEEVPASVRAPILKEYMQVAPGARPHMPIDKDAPLDDFEKIAPHYPVFRVQSK